jgi:hypothetical protein
MRKLIPLLAMAAVGLSAGPASAKNGRASCTFANPTYSGQCVETAEIPEGATATQACETILACLNDVQCLKTYCRATEIRSGWTLVSAEAAQEGNGK